ncbi:glycosyl hydrolase family 18 protein [Kyrpidia tusciae]|uniref:Glycoside hydrolase family 18 n=1 Tax=Kyrpidia tusciae (strain DSM 2912 / NBRC 15312 / T2) TaxID=562970 RepID=D5WV19_KYRT2|nr:glycosyl hydrolase family 18 protein [Kyrpidia tusciae]ADG07491.1 glycoside hydrolase family 18 [Kyrpidia tusciae DSM 2912]
MQIHVVQRGESLWSISRRYGVALNEIAAANQLPDPNRLVPGLALVIPTPSPGPKPTIDVNAFTFQFSPAGAQEVRREGRNLTYMSPFAYRIRSDGTLETIDDTALIQAAVATRVVPMMAITNFTSRELGTDRAHAVLSSTAVQDRLLNNIVAIMRNKGYRGLNIDFENVLSADRQAYNAFLQRAVNRLHAENYFVSTSLAPKTSGAQRGLLYEAHDYPAHGRIADFVVLMTYEWGYRLGPPRAISPVNLIRGVLDYAVSVIPRNKILMGFQIYARDWRIPHRPGMQAETISNQEAVRRAVQHGAVIQYDWTAQSPYFRYWDARGQGHEVWFEDARSAQAKFNLVKSYRLRGLSYWVLGYPFPQNWLLLEDNFTVRKR